MDGARRKVLCTLAAASLFAGVARGAGEPRLWRIAMPVDPRSDTDAYLRVVATELALHGLREGLDFVLVPIPMRFQNPGVGYMESWESSARDVVRVHPDLILSSGTEFVRILTRLAPETPIVFFMIGDPVLSRLVKSMGKPGGNVTGVSNRFVDLVGKRVELLKELSPRIRRVGLLMHGAIDGPTTRKEFFQAVRSLGVEGVELRIPPEFDVAALSRICSKAGVDAVFDGRAVADPGIAETAEAMSRCGVPAIYTRVEIVEAGGLMSLGARPDDQLKSALAIVAKIVRGAHPGSVPVDQLSKIHLAVNLRTAARLKLAVPQSILLRADQVLR